MLWPFNHLRKPRSSPRETIGAIYGMIVAQTREPLFYRHLDVPDSVDGRLDLLILHLWLVLGRMRSVPGGAGLSQALFDQFCNDMDDNLREMGVGDLAVPRRMQAFGEAFYGRTAAYDMARSDGAARLAEALQKNILNGGHPGSARALSAYAGQVADRLAALDDAAFVRADWSFPPPLQRQD
jgi:cytochrome b pre-mRNA-processing protein 3